jgi:hypothetical protein
MKPYQDLAFPFSPNQIVGGGSMMPDRGMTLRDYFAAKAMQGIIAGRSWHPDYVFPDNFEFSANEKASFSTAQAAYKYADEMMEARK